MTAQDKALRDQIALNVMNICVSDLSRQLSDGRMPIDDAEKAVDFITRFSYATADAMLKARKAK